MAKHALQNEGIVLQQEFALSRFYRPVQLGTAVCLMAFAASAQEAPPVSDPAADLATLEQKIAKDPQMGSAFAQVAQMFDRSTVTINEAREMVFGNFLGRNPEISAGQPYEYRKEKESRLAEQRAQLLSDVLRGDLDGDWQLSRDEIIWLGRQQNRGTMAATMLLTGDADRNDILSLAELTAAVSEMAADMTRRDGRRGGSLEALFDFDDDGALSMQELDRGLAAILMPLP